MIDLSEFGPWREKVCFECETLQLVVGPPGGPFKCKACWLGPPEGRWRRRSTQEEALFDREAYRRGHQR